MLRDLMHCKLASLFLDIFFNKFQVQRNRHVCCGCFFPNTMPLLAWDQNINLNMYQELEVQKSQAVESYELWTRPYHRPSCFYEKVKMEHKQVMSDLQRLKNDNRDASEKFRELTEEKGFYCLTETSCFWRIKHNEEDEGDLSNNCEFSLLLSPDPIDDDYYSSIVDF
ncbi:hypothetical protein STEG23_016837, partial [Scotinomys teguina]